MTLLLLFRSRKRAGDGQGSGAIGGTFTRGDWHTVIGAAAAEHDAIARKRKRRAEREAERKRLIAEEEATQRLAQLVAEENARRELARKMIAAHAFEAARTIQLVQQQGIADVQRARMIAQAEQDDEEALAALLLLDTPGTVH